MMTPGFLRSSVPVDGEGDIPEPSILSAREKNHNSKYNLRLVSHFIIYYNEHFSIMCIYYTAYPVLGRG